MIWVWSICEKKYYWFWCVNKTVGYFDPKVSQASFVSVYIRAVQTLISLESVFYAWVISLDFAKVRFIFLLLDVIVKVLRLFQNWMRHILRKMVIIMFKFNIIFFNLFWSPIVHSEFFCCLKML